MSSPQSVGGPQAGDTGGGAVSCGRLHRGHCPLANLRFEGSRFLLELSDAKVENAEEVVTVGDPVEVKVLRIDTDERKIGLSKKRVGWSKERQAAEGEPEV